MRLSKRAMRNDEHERGSGTWNMVEGNNEEGGGVYGGTESEMRIDAS